MSKELEAYDIVFNSFNNCTCQDGRFPIRSALDTIYQALNELEDAKHNYKALKEFYDNAVAYAAKIQNELNELKKSEEELDWSDEK